MPSIRRFIGSRLVYTPLMAIVIFLVVMAIIYKFKNGNNKKVPYFAN
jgi:hypothetical protein